MFVHYAYVSYLLKAYDTLFVIMSYFEVYMMFVRVSVCVCTCVCDMR